MKPHRAASPRETAYKVRPPGRTPRRIVSEILLLFLVLFLPGMLVTGEAVDVHLFDHLEFHITYALVALPQIALIVYLIKTGRDMWPPEFGLRRLRLRDLLYAGVILVLLYLTLAAVIATATGLQQLGIEVSAPTGGGFRLTRPELLPLVAITSLLTGYREELFFRAYMLPRLRQAGVAFPGAVLVSTALFAVGHLYQGLLGLAFAAVIGVILALAFRRRRSVHPIGLAHAGYNFLTLVFTLAVENTIPS